VKYSNYGAQAQAAQTSDGSAHKDVEVIENIGPASIVEDQYGMSNLEYHTYQQDCQESLELYADIQHFLITDPDVSSYLF